MRDFEGRTALITGAGSGIGASLAHAAAARGMKLALADINKADVEKVAASIGCDDILTLCADVSDAAQVQAMADRVWDCFGSVDLLCNNAGVVPGGRHRFVWEFSLEDWQWALGVNVFGVVNGIRSFVPRMIAANKPAHVLNTASVAGFVSGAGSAVYGASKHAVVRITEALYAGLTEVAPAIGVTLLCPGLVATGIYNAERNRPQHLASVGGPAAESVELQSLADSLYRNALSPDVVAAMAFQGIEDKRLYVFTTDNFDQSVRQRTADILSRTNPQFENLLSLTKSDLGMETAK